ncbi:hypothetical protein G4B88_001062 [Cannabis sativa]|uniref:Uncharacterized protein n=1 Tax=Cannabis sativa TaxID=3483 RepID=A0A7J6DJ44_CANSA|nr:hypothetical protein G4B88_001062 [Cannabis sativa]
MLHILLAPRSKIGTRSEKPGLIRTRSFLAMLHGIEIVYNLAHLDKELAGYWAKFPLLRRLMLSHSEIVWIWWMDSDALFTVDRNLIVDMINT